MEPQYTGFLFGNYPELSLLELKILLQRLNRSDVPQFILPNLAVIPYNPAYQPEINFLGGTVKIGTVYELGQSDLTEIIVSDLKAKSANHAGFFTSVPNLDAKILAQTVKAACLEVGIKLHFRLLDKPTYGAGVISPWSDYLVFPCPNSNFRLFVTKRVQDLAHWNQKDYDRPLVSPKIGMLPPKISRMLVNLGIGQRQPASVSLYDPFCGSGTILIEALDLGVSQVYGSDLNPGQIHASQKNCQWFCQTFTVPDSFYLQVLDVMSLSPGAFPQKLDTIVFEGYLGPPNLDGLNLTNQLKGLTKFYHGVFKRLKSILSSGGTIAAALPAYTGPDGNLHTMQSLIDTCEKLGYTFTVPPLIVGRHQALVKREIYLLKLS